MKKNDSEGLYMEEKINSVRIVTPKYQQIAADIASKIAIGTYKVGDRIYARSSLASQYGVSAETARRAICVLSDLGIVYSEKGSGVTIRSFDKAVQFARRFEDVQTINDIKADILKSVERQKKELKVFNNHLNSLIEKTDRFRCMNPFMPFQIDIKSTCPYLNQSVTSTNFWHNTTATIIAIKRHDEILISPGPYAIFLENDVLFFVGKDDCYQRVSNFLYPNQ